MALAKKDQNNKINQNNNKTKHVLIDTTLHTKLKLLSMELDHPIVAKQVDVKASIKDLVDLAVILMLEQHSPSTILKFLEMKQIK